ncbi:MAG: nucleotidyltransferase family protein [Pirellulaceae bacterium]|nr:nucleotidyltransferase family protein [Pirellulaceae bacterium]
MSTVPNAPGPPWKDIYAQYEAVMAAQERRLVAITSALARAQVPYALVGGQAVIQWISTIDPDATRTTKDIDILLDRVDFPRAQRAASEAGFEFVDGPAGPQFLERVNPSPKRAVDIVWANEPFRPEVAYLAPTMHDVVVVPNGLAVVSLLALVQMILEAWRRHDQVHLDDLLKVGLIDASWCAWLPHELAARLQLLIDTSDEA